MILRDAIMHSFAARGILFDFAGWLRSPATYHKYVAQATCSRNAECMNGEKGRKLRVLHVHVLMFYLLDGLMYGVRVH